MAFHTRFHANKVSALAPILSQFNLENVCKPGNTLLWDLLQDDKIVSHAMKIVVSKMLNLIRKLHHNFSVVINLI